MEMNGTEIYMYLQETNSLSFIEIYKLLELVILWISRIEISKNPLDSQLVQACITS